MAIGDFGEDDTVTIDTTKGNTVGGSWMDAIAVGKGGLSIELSSTFINCFGRCGAATEITGTMASNITSPVMSAAVGGPEFLEAKADSIAR